MQGRRLPNGKGPDGHNPGLAEGDYWKDESGIWHARPPGGHLGCLSNHEVEEHEDGTITVRPSILQEPLKLFEKPDLPSWHGYLTHGVWQTC
jgi:hypothetical protein